MTPASAFLLIQPFIFLTFAFVSWRWSPVRRKQELLAASLIAENPDAERCDGLIALQSSWALGKQDEINRRIQLMQEQGWTYLKMSVVSQWGSLWSWGGAVRLHFIRTPMTVQNGEQPYQEDLQ
jgi:hypothetical protein